MPKKTKVCTSCGRELPLSTGFYSSKSPLFASDKKINICKECFISNSLNQETLEIDEVKFKNMLRRTDFPYYKDNLQSAANQYSKEHGHVADEDIKYHGGDIIKLYMKNVNSLRQLSSKTFEDSEKDGFLQKRSSVMRNHSGNVIMISNSSDEESSSNTDINKEDVKWSKKDKQNMKYVISTIGYDPLEDLGMSEYDKKYCFNILSGYCDTPGISEDGHKLHSVIEMAILYAQCRKLTEEMNIEFNKKSVDDAKISKLSSSKSALLSSISKIAKDNNISSNYNKNSRQGQDSLSSKMKEMEENGFSEIEVNLFDIKTSEAFKQIDQISNENIANQLTLDSNEYTDIIKEQREMITTYESQINELNEENRMLKNKIIDLENYKR